MNVLNIITIYKWQTFWVFDAPEHGLEHEGLVEGTDLIIDELVKDIPNAQDGFICIFSSNPFPSAQLELTLKERGDINNGNWYTSTALGIDGWLCGALYHYFETEPETIYIQVKPKVA